ncbi:MAG TPA: adenosylcobinamide-GDP ribazoletransferase [Burkholderiaceae bacterium]|nr:adenosylcobinamide-GDP ribazoletransferase [Burkholderiaceae bacterium]
MSSSPLQLFRLAMRAYARAPEERLLSPPAGGELGRAMRHLPLIGLLVGALFAVTYVLLAQLVPHSVAVLLAIAVTALVTGGHHEIGWMRFCDAARHDDDGQQPKATARAVGAVGAVAMVLSALLKLEALSSLDPSWISVAALTGHPLSRGLAVAALTGLNGREQGPAVLRPTWLFALVAGLVPALVAAWWLENELAFACGLLPALFAMLLIRRLGRRRAAADSQSVLGAAQQLTELAWYLGLLAWWTLAAAPATETPIE